MKYLLLLATVLLLSSCATIPPPPLPSSDYLNALSSGAVGCPPQQVQTYNIQESNGQQQTNGPQTYWVNNVYTWQAQCNGKVYYCSAATPNFGDQDANVRSVNCAPAQTQ
jgi:hypothetical protein